MASSCESVNGPPCRFIRATSRSTYAALMASEARAESRGDRPGKGQWSCSDIRSGGAGISTVLARFGAEKSSA
ncbi:hypothetical protein D3C71_1931330 [compost metagenome]